MNPSHADSPEQTTTFQRKIRSFVRREGRMSKRQTTAYDSLFPKYGLEFNRQLLDLSRIFDRTAPTILEIGFGMGNSLAIMAMDNPEINYIGIEVHRPGVGSLLATIEEQNIKNIRIFCHDAVEILEQSIPDHGLDGIHIFFPDPWPKKRHHKRRLIQPAFVNLLSQKLNPQGTLHIATDWKNYAEWIEEIMTANADFARLPDNTPHQRPTTKFEKRGIMLGHGVWDLIYKKA
jgi:tRNA (guanine-N7-)-methyltransferase